MDTLIYVNKLINNTNVNKLNINSGKTINDNCETLDNLYNYRFLFYYYQNINYDLFIPQKLICYNCSNNFQITEISLVTPKYLNYLITLRENDLDFLNVLNIIEKKII